MRAKTEVWSSGAVNRSTVLYGDLGRGVVRTFLVLFIIVTGQTTRHLRHRHTWDHQKTLLRFFDTTGYCPLGCANHKVSACFLSSLPAVQDGVMSIALRTAAESP